MALSFETLPEDVILLVLELGRVGPEDALSLRQTSRSLYELSNQPSFWVIVTRNASRLDPLPLPLFRKLETLSAVEARELCTRHLRTKRNLESKAPRYRKHRLFSLPQGSDWLSHFGFLPGGKLGITIQDDGMISIYDLSVSAAGVNTGNDGSSPSSSEESIPVGRLVAQYCVGWPVDLFDFRFQEDTGKHLTVAVSLYTPSRAHAGRTEVAVIRFDFVDDNSLEAPSQPKELCRVALGIEFAQPIVLRGDLLVMLGMTKTGNVSEKRTTLIAINFKMGLISMLEHPSLDLGPESSSSLDLTVDGTDIILYRFTRDMSLEFLVYFDVTRDMHPLSNSVSRDTASKRGPDIHTVIDLSPVVPLAPDCIWEPLHIYSTPNNSSANHVPLIGRSIARRTGSPNSEAITTLAWIDGKGLVNYLKNSGYNATPNELKAYINGHSYFKHGRYLQPGAASGWTKYGIGTCGRRVFWVKHEMVSLESTQEVQDELRIVSEIEVVTLPFVGQLFDEEDTARAVRKLSVPLNLSNETVLTLKFCDKWGMLGYMKSSDRDRQEVHIFDY